MNRFLQLHLLTSYPPSNLNRDDLGRPKTATMGGVQRLRISSQSLKRAWRTSEPFENSLKGRLGTRTKKMGDRIKVRLMDKGVSEKKAIEWTTKIAGVFGKVKNEGLEIEQLAHFSPEEIIAIESLVDLLALEGRGPEGDELKLLVERHRAADIALFGRMLASSPKYNTEAAVQVAHAITVHKVAVEDDFFTAVDDLNTHEIDAGSAHMGETGFAAGLFYLYVCIDCQSLLENLSGDETLAATTVTALIEAAARVAPTGKQNSFASRANASYIFVERGDQQPRSLSVAFLKPIGGFDLLADAISALQTCSNNMDKVYGPCAEANDEMNAVTGKGTLAALQSFAADAMRKRAEQ